MIRLDRAYDTLRLTEIVLPFFVLLGLFLVGCGIPIDTPIVSTESEPREGEAHVEVSCGLGPSLRVWRDVEGASISKGPGGWSFTTHDGQVYVLSNSTPCILHLGRVLTPEEVEEKEREAEEALLEHRGTPG